MSSTASQLRILITNIGILHRTGTEIVAMDLARGLARAGHLPMIWAPQLRGDLVADLVASGIPVVSRLADLPTAPDVIHGHHHLETIEAVRHFEGVPAIFVSHSGHWWHDAPPRHPGIRRYVAVDDFCRERLDRVSWIPGGRVSTIRNSVDMRLYRARLPLPARPARALIFSNYAGPGTHVEAIEAACRTTGLALDVAGGGVGNLITRPELVLPAYDLVFAKARCALEAMAVGCAVILCDTEGLGGMVDSANIALFRRWNFGFRLLTGPLTCEAVAAEIRRYDSGEAARVSDWIRREAGLDESVTEYISLYRAAISDQPFEPAIDCYPATECVQIAHQAALRLRLNGVPEQAETGRHFEIAASIDNGSPIAIATAAPWPAFFTYRWLDANTGACIVEHGFRSIIQPPSLPGSETGYEIRIIAPQIPGNYKLRVTIIQEGWRWLDHLDPALYAETPVVVVPVRSGRIIANEALGSPT